MHLDKDTYVEILTVTWVLADSSWPVCCLREWNVWCKNINLLKLVC